jgi:hypothetical protein
LLTGRGSGSKFKRVVAIGVIYFVLALVERCTVIYGVSITIYLTLRATLDYFSPILHVLLLLLQVTADFKVSLFILVPLSVCDALICWWISLIGCLVTHAKITPNYK